MSRAKTIFLFYVTTIFYFFVFIGNVLGSGFDNSGIGIRGHALGSAYAGCADDASAVYYNPAGLALSKSLWNFEIYSFAVFTEFEYTTPSTEDESDNTFVIPGFFLSRKLENWAIGFGFFVPYAGGGTKYKNFNGSGYDMESSSGFSALTPAVAYRINPNLSIGIGGSIYMGLMENEVFDNDIQGVVKGEYEGIAGYGFNAGLIYKPTKTLSTGFTLKSEIPIDMDGEIELPNSSKIDSDVDFTLPYYFTFGVGYTPNSILTFTLDFTYMLWNDLDKISFDTAGVTSEEKTYYENCWRIGGGFEYLINDNFAFRNGLKFMQSATKDKGLNPLSNDVDLLAYSASLAWNITPSIELSTILFYTYGFEEEYNDEKYVQSNYTIEIGARFRP